MRFGGPLVASLTLSAVLLPTSPWARDSSSLHQYLTDYTRANDFQGSVLVARQHKVLLRSAYGWANRELDVRTAVASKFRIGSISKQFTATAVLLLEQNGALKLDDSICKYLERCPAAWTAITLRQVLAHSSGIPDLVRLPEFPNMITLRTTLDATIDHFRDLPLNFEPGTRVEYGNSGYLVATRIIEKVSGQNYEDFLRLQIFEVAGMKDTGYDHPETVLKQRASGYVKHDGVIENASYIDMSIPAGAGGLFSTVDDLFRYVEALASGRLLSLRVVHQAMSKQSSDYGLGWEVSDSGGESMVSHIGDINGFGAFVVYFPNKRVFAAALTNLEGTPVKDLCLSLATMALE
jgi:CubicO group peptidase (beta-lactamase class C family)